MILIAATSGYFSSEQLAALAEAGLQVMPINSPGELSTRRCAVLCLTPGLLNGEGMRADWLTSAGDAGIVTDETLANADDIRVSNHWPTEAIVNTLKLAACAAYLRRFEVMFDGFVTAAVTAIEQRDPVTSGHSLRVARMTVGLAKSLTRSGFPRFHDAKFSDGQLQELRYAALLHDFGKIGVPEHVLVKSHKLNREDFLSIRERVSGEAERLKRRALAQELVMLRSGMGSKQELQAIEQELEDRLAALDAYWQAIQEANQPEMVTRRHSRKKFTLDYALAEEGTPLLTAEERRILEIPRGSLTDAERREIESHVAHTSDFLQRIPWPEGLAGIPEIVAAHHEKLDGSGYPHGHTQADIPFPSRLMAVADIYDALLLSDRSHKKNMPSERVLTVLEDEAKCGRLDADLVSIFIDAKIFALAGGDGAVASGVSVPRSG